MFISEERQIVERIKDFIKSKETIGTLIYIMLRNGRILGFEDYSKMVKSGKINPRDAYVDIGLDFSPFRADFYYPFLNWHANLLDAYLSKLGFNAKYFAIAPATGLKYVTFVVVYGGYLVIEVSNLDTVVNNLNLPKVVFEVLGEKLISGKKYLTEEEYDKIHDIYKSQQLFAGYDIIKAWSIISDYYGYGDKSLANEVARIATDYIKIFNPYTVCYEIGTWKEIDCWSIKLD